MSVPPAIAGGSSSQSLRPGSTAPPFDVRKVYDLPPTSHNVLGLRPISEASLPNDAQQAASTPTTHWRVFCALPLPHSLRELVQAHIARLRESVPEARASWNRADKLHLTIKFLGDVAVDRVPALSLAVERAVSEVKPFTLAAEDCGAFPERGQPRVLWIGVKDDAQELLRLNQRLEEECADQDFAREPRPFRPHLTIARVRPSSAARQLAAAHRELGFPRQEFQVNELMVIRSELSAAGSHYTEISQHPLL